ncbi:hypothetical protein BVRB_5g112700 [Beta vulgaris subsp. vulgaris]|uniref:Aspartate transaminase n=1 Tax=Beta vulgaris subsp. vulgaris TaxID=3555 RepID=A0A0J8CB08_BETVV|nr:hypothetical protein BVRB_5g112700 [Beta vulgaris subsp. vulgaris]
MFACSCMESEDLTTLQGFIPLVAVNKKSSSPANFELCPCASILHFEKFYEASTYFIEPNNGNAEHDVGCAPSILPIVDPDNIGTSSSVESKEVEECPEHDHGDAPTTLYIVGSEASSNMESKETEVCHGHVDEYAENFAADAPTVVGSGTALRSSLDSKETEELCWHNNGRAELDVGNAPTASITIGSDGEPVLTLNIKGNEDRQVIVDSGSCANVYALSMVEEVQLATQDHPRTYKLSWLDEKSGVWVKKQALISFRIGGYVDQLWCDMVTVAYNKDPSHVKLNLGVGAYRTEEGKPLVLNVVRKAEQKLAEKITTVISATNIECESYWTSLFAKLLEKKSIEDLIMNVGAGGGAAPAAAFAIGDAAAAPAAAEKEEKKAIVLSTITQGCALGWAEAQYNRPEESLPRNSMRTEDFISCDFAFAMDC